MNLREQAEKDLAITLEDLGGFGLPVLLQKKDSVDIELVSGQVLYEYVSFNPDTGTEIVVQAPVVSIRISSLTTVPVDGDVWYFDIPETPSLTSPLKRYVIDQDISKRGSPSIGFLMFYLRQYKDSRS